MKRLIAAVVACALIPLASADLYKYVDKNGKTVYSDQPPPDADAKRISPPPAPASGGGKSYVERDKANQKARDKAQEGAKKSADEEKVAKAKKERCEQARNNLQIYTDGGPILKRNDKGEREYMSDAEIESERGRMQKMVDEACAK
jgi:hypothetical protein